MSAAPKTLHLNEDNEHKASAGGLPWILAGSLLLAALCTLFGTGIVDISDGIDTMTQPKPSETETKPDSSNEQVAPPEETAQKESNEQVSPHEETTQEEPKENAKEEPALRAEYTAMSQSDNSNRLQNIARACEALDGKKLAPGEELSLDQVLGDTTAEPYLEAPIVLDGGMKLARGGGICQLSTALYVASLKAELEIVERHPHMVATDYAPLGLDATISHGTLDLRIRNNTGAPLEIRASSSGQTCTVQIYGESLPEGEESQVVSELADRYTKLDADGNEVVYFNTNAYRVIYQDGFVVSRELLSNDVYCEFGDAAVELSEGGVEDVK